MSAMSKGFIVIKNILGRGLFILFTVGVAVLCAGQNTELDYLAQRKAAEQGDVEAQFNLAGMYAEGLGVAKDEAEATKWYRKAAEQGDIDAQFNLGGRYVDGRGVEKNEVEAVKWYLKAADQGDAYAQFNLGMMYAEGRGVAKDEAESAKWYSKAAEQGNPEVQAALDDLHAQERSEDSAPSHSLQEKLKAIVIPAVDFRQANIRDVVNFLIEASIAADPEQKGVNIILNVDQTGVPDITLNLRRITLLDAIKYITAVASLEYSIGADAVNITRQVAPRIEDNAPSHALQEKLKAIVIPAVDFRQANIHDVVNFLVEASMAADPEQKGVNIILNIGQAKVPGITLNLRRISMFDAIKNITAVAGVEYSIGAEAVTITPILARTGSAKNIGEKAKPPVFTGDITTKSGKTYSNIVVRRVEPDGISIKHSAGIIKLFVQELPPEILDMYNLNSESAWRYQVNKNAILQDREVQMRDNLERRNAEWAQAENAREDRELLMRNAKTISAKIVQITQDGCLARQANGELIYIVGDTKIKKIGEYWKGKAAFAGIYPPNDPEGISMYQETK